MPHNSHGHISSFSRLSLSLSAPYQDIVVGTMPGFSLGDTIHPRPSPDFTPVCTRELGKMAMYAEEFETRGVKPLGFSCDDVASHVEWIKDVEDYATANFEVATPVNWKPGEPVVMEYADVGLGRPAGDP
ncbi:hypothetical protein BHE74_00059387 [Ensete ventricosum]|nr:hypothetical protein BHE74_00059387 [Ensete ventricosum]